MRAVFVHGLWLHASSWDAWIERFGEAGYTSLAPGWPGESAAIQEAREQPERVAGNGIDEVVDHYVKVIASLDSKPVVVGHSFGGLIAQRLLTEGHAAAAVAIDPAPMKGVLYLPPSALRVASIGLRNPANKGRAVALTREQFRYGFGNALSEEESNALYDKWTIPSPMKPLFEAAFAALAQHSPATVDTKNSSRGPLLLTAGGRDHTVPAVVVRQALKRYKNSSAVTDYEEFPNLGHSLTIDRGWRDVADRALAWLDRQRTTIEERATLPSS